METIIGIDVGKRQDPSAIAVCNAEMRGSITHYTIPFLTRLPLEMPYPKQAEQLVILINRAATVAQATLRVLVDVTGVGDPVIDLLKQAGIRNLYSCRFVGGDKISKPDPKKNRTIGKAAFVSKMQIVVEGHRIHLPMTPTAEAEELKKEMLDFDIDVDEASGKSTFGALRPGTHDDMVTAIGLCVLEDFQKKWTDADLVNNPPATCRMPIDDYCSFIKSDAQLDFEAAHRSHSPPPAEPISQDEYKAAHSPYVEPIVRDDFVNSHQDHQKVPKRQKGDR